MFHIRFAYRLLGYHGKLHGLEALGRSSKGDGARLSPGTEYDGAGAIEETAGVAHHHLIAIDVAINDADYLRIALHGEGHLVASCLYTTTLTVECHNAHMLEVIAIGCPFTIH